MYGKEIVVADREMVESHADIFLDQAATEDVAFLVVGDPFGYTFALCVAWSVGL